MLHGKCSLQSDIAIIAPLSMPILAATFSSWVLYGQHMSLSVRFIGIVDCEGPPDMNIAIIDPLISHLLSLCSSFPVSPVVFN